MKTKSRRRKLNLTRNSETDQNVRSPKCSKAEAEHSSQLKPNVPDADSEDDQTEVMEKSSLGSGKRQNAVTGLQPFLSTFLSLISYLLSSCSKKSQELSNEKLKNKILSEKVSKLEKKLQIMKKSCECSKPLYKTLLNEKNISFFTCLPSIDVFKVIHDFVAPSVKRRWKGVSMLSTKVKKRFSKSPKTFGPQRKLGSEDELLLTLMKLRLGLLFRDLAARFKISAGLCSQIFHSWIQTMAECLKSMIFFPDSDTIKATTLSRFKHLKNTHSIIDCSEIFIETPKSHSLQSATWSDYKHHNTLKFLIAVAPNSNIIYVSEAYCGKISDKKLTQDCGYLDNVPPYMRVIADKGFNIADDCAARHIFLSVPPGKRGAAQFMPKDVTKTCKIAKVCILVEQVIRQMKTFRLIANELPLSLAHQVNDILTVCAALINISQKPIYKD